MFLLWVFRNSAVIIHVIMVNANVIVVKNYIIVPDSNFIDIIIVIIIDYITDNANDIISVIISNSFIFNLVIIWLFF